MPRFHSQIVDYAAFTFRTREEAEKRVPMGGTCFAVLKFLNNPMGAPLAIPYFITNRHVVYANGASVVSVNRLDGGPPDIMEFEPTDWIPHPAGDDLAAIIPTDYKYDRHRLHAFRSVDLLTRDRIKADDIGIGDEVVMIGRFVNHQGKKENRASVRFGNISMMPEDIWVKNDHRYQRSYAVEMRSRTGFSGSPVVVYRTNIIQNDKRSTAYTNLFGLLGVNWGYILDEETGENTFLNGVIPAWKILELLEVPALKDKHDEFEKAFLEGMKTGFKTGAVQASAWEMPASTTSENPDHQVEAAHP